VFQKEGRSRKQPKGVPFPPPSGEGRGKGFFEWTLSAGSKMGVPSPLTLLSKERRGSSSFPFPYLGRR